MEKIFLKIYNKYKNSGDFLVTFQNHKIENVSGILNINNHVSYDWLKARIGYYPIWTIKVTEYYRKDFNEFKRLLGATLSTNNKYIYILDPSKLECIDTYLYAWVDVHLIENDGIESDDDKYIKEKYDADWKSYILSDNYIDNENLEIQTLIPHINEDSILEIIKNIY